MKIPDMQTADKTAKMIKVANSFIASFYCKLLLKDLRSVSW